MERRTLCAVFLAGALASVSLAPAADIATGLLVAYNFESGSGTTVIDRSGNGHNGTVVGAAWSSAEFKNGNFSMNFGDGGAPATERDHVDLNNLDIPGSAMTLMAWIKVRTFPRADPRIISKAVGINTNDHLWMISTINAAHNPRFRLMTDAAPGVTATLIGTSGVVSTDVWTHIAAVYDGAAMTVYLNAVQAGTMAKTGAIVQAPATQVFIGDSPGPEERAFDGYIDDVRIYSRALTLADLQAAMNTPVVEASGVGDWRDF
ncbi:MAG: hypothetical protein BWZ10_00468 [candidate division BRC1 bacterium ADurb.BinA364]|nr:MAG: hypothetical protein BWZ10_00468 [candidate division BRC1 bacterium ADurb.BinA364]